MNERIKKLAEEAGFEFEYNCGPLEGEGEIYYGKEFEKLAELIVAECILVIQMRILRNGYTPENQRSMLHLNDIAGLFGIDFEKFKPGSDQVSRVMEYCQKNKFQ